MTIVNLYDLGAQEPLTTEISSDLSIRKALHLEADDVLALIEDDDEAASAATDLAVIDDALSITDIAPRRLSIDLLRNPLAKIAVHVSYTGSEVVLHVHAATRLRKVRRLAVRDLGLDAEAAADTSLRLEGTDADLPLVRPVGTYLKKGEHKLELDLVHRVRVQG